MFWILAGSSAPEFLSLRFSFIDGCVEVLYKNRDKLIFGQNLARFFTLIHWFRINISMG
jgi:hypothetical protein